MITILAIATASAVRREMLLLAPLATELPRMSMLTGTAAAPILAIPLKSHCRGASPFRSLVSTSTPRTGSANATAMPRSAAMTGGGKTRRNTVKNLVRLVPFDSSWDVNRWLGSAPAMGASGDCGEFIPMWKVPGRRVSSNSMRTESGPEKLWWFPWRGRARTTSKPLGAREAMGGSGSMSSRKTLSGRSGSRLPGELLLLSGVRGRNNQEPTDHCSTG
mmetsp:Transcript_32876/g.102676  ORF Transcript_32876/g.102676 Transcript_32876/m.102676 type:complete len:219 (-) Transcript_32876:534-1190(-)